MLLALSTENSQSQSFAMNWINMDNFDVFLNVCLSNQWRMTSEIRRNTINMASLLSMEYSTCYRIKINHPELVVYMSQFIHIKL